MSKIPKEIVDKIEQRNKLNEEIETWCKEHLDMDGMDSDCADITDHHIGKEQGNDECKEWSEQWSGYEDAEEKDRLGQWIPCSERLPENNTDVIVCFYSGTVTEMACIQEHVVIDIKNAIKGPINDRIAFYNSLIAQHRWKIMKHCTHIIAAFEEAVYDEKKKNMDVRLDDGEMNVDSLDSTEYSTESIQDEIMYIAA